MCTGQERRDYAPGRLKGMRLDDPAAYVARRLERYSHSYDALADPDAVVSGDFRAYFEHERTPWALGRHCWEPIVARLYAQTRHETITTFHHSYLAAFCIGVMIVLQPVYLSAGVSPPSAVIGLTGQATPDHLQALAD